MRNAFVVLVSLYIGLASGFIVPPGVTEKLSETSNININNNNKTQLDETTNSTIEELLYENANEKENTLKERSFIYINQKYKPTLKNSGYGLNVQGWSPRINEDRSVMISKDSARFNDLPYRYSAENIDNSKRVVMSNYRINVADVPDYVPYVLNKHNSKIIKNDYRPKYELNDNQVESRTSNKQREYLELFKVPLIKLRDQTKPRNDYNNNNDLHKLNAETYNYEPYSFPKIEIPSDSKKPNKFGYPKYSSMRKNVNHNNKSHDNVPSNFDDRRLFEKNNLDFLQHKEANEIINHDDCDYSRCLVNSVVQEVIKSQYTGKLPKCSCVDRTNLIPKGRSAAIDRSQREKLNDHSKSPLLSPPENNDYEEMINEEDDFVNVNKLSETLRL